MLILVFIFQIFPLQYFFTSISRHIVSLLSIIQIRILQDNMIFWLQMASVPSDDQGYIDFVAHLEKKCHTLTWWRWYFHFRFVIFRIAFVLRSPVYCRVVFLIDLLHISSHSYLLVHRYSRLLSTFFFLYVLYRQDCFLYCYRFFTILHHMFCTLYSYPIF